MQLITEWYMSNKTNPVPHIQPLQLFFQCNFEFYFFKYKLFMATKWNDVRDKFVNLLKAELYVEVVDVGSLLLRRKRA